MSRPGPIEKRELWGVHQANAAAYELMWELNAAHITDVMTAFIGMCDEDEHHCPNRHPGFQAAKAAMYQRFSK